MNHRRRHHRALRHARRRMTDAQMFEDHFRRYARRRMTDDIYRPNLLLQALAGYRRH